MSSKAKKDTQPDPATLTYEVAAEELEDIIRRIDGGDVGLDDAMALHRRGQALVGRCRGLLEAAEEELRKLSEGDLDAAAGDGD